MDTKGSQNLSPCNLASIPLTEEDGVVYIAIKGSLHANDCSVFGLGEEEIRALSKKFPGSGVVVNGVSIKSNVLETLNSLGQLGYKIISSTGETEITWTLQRII
ncbi:uncharacterized protein LOC110380356 [Helicoverpa armigera]|uniref:GTP cyclohydrolase 1 feedback regulatory protein n=1 Tax=Helicoverpa armigera TaxID=29058 RepID=A0A2W1BLW3_HELAM|nr:uncharacterized protein LOC110380356 [Helicoverpa armigera]XP_047041617.1 uncharacterized protein LOC124645780 [Helicoverpa zea]PZC73700.1 hypothetical protein B5X24_HaOG208971 [Helicoverpa armigera]